MEEPITLEGVLLSLHVTVEDREGIKRTVIFDQPYHMQIDLY